MPRIFLVLIEISQNSYEVISYPSTSPVFSLRLHTPRKGWEKLPCCIWSNNFWTWTWKSQSDTCLQVHWLHPWHLRQAQIGKENFSDHSQPLKACRSRPISSSSRYLVTYHETKHKVALCKADTESSHIWAKGFQGSFIWSMFCKCNSKMTKVWETMAGGIYERSTSRLLSCEVPLIVSIHCSCPSTILGQAQRGEDKVMRKESVLIFKE